MPKIDEASLGNTPLHEGRGSRERDKKINHLLTRGVENVYPDKQTLKKVLMSGKKLKLYHGIDPTSNTLHLGHMVQLMKLRQFQKLGHKVTVLIGDFTAQIGDPTDKAATRVRLTYQQVLDNCKNYKTQIAKFLDLKKTEIKYNSRWLGKLKFSDVVELASNFTAGQMLARDMFKKRIAEGKDLYLHEFLYPLMQAYDSVVLNVDLEIGGNDQMFNMLAGRTLMKKMKNKEKFVLTTKLLEDPTGKKMGKTEGNIIALSDSPDEMFGKVMNWTDGMILIGFELLTEISDGEIKMFEKDLKGGANPRDLKFKLAQEIVTQYYGLEDALRAGEKFNKQFKEKEKPEEIEEKKVGQKLLNIVDLIFELGLAGSRGEARRLIEQGGVKIDDLKITDWGSVIGIHEGMIIQVGRRKFVKIRK